MIRFSVPESIIKDAIQWLIDNVGPYDGRTWTWDIYRAPFRIILRVMDEEKATLLKLFHSEIVLL